MAGGGVGAGRVRRSQRLREAPRRRAAAAAGVAPEEWRDWAGLPEDLLVKVAGKLVAQDEAGWAARLKERGNREGYIQRKMEQRKRDGNCLFVFARVCKQWRKAQLKVGGPLRTRVCSDVLRSGSVALAKWALAEGCPRVDRYGFTMALAAARYGRAELVKWLCGEGGFAMDEWVKRHAATSGNLKLVQWLWGAGGFAMDEWLMANAARSGNLELIQWLRGEGCPWDAGTCYHAVDVGCVEVLRWDRENGCPWTAGTRDDAAEKLGYTDDLGNLVNYAGYPVQQ